MSHILEHKFQSGARNIIRIVQSITSDMFITRNAKVMYTHNFGYARSGFILFDRRVPSSTTKVAEGRDRLSACF